MKKLSNSIPALSPDNLDIGDKYMVSRHRRNILEGLGVQRRDLPTIASEQVLMLKAFKAEKPELYCKLFDLYVRGIQPDMNPELKDDDIEDLKKEAISEIIATRDMAVVQQRDEINRIIERANVAFNEKINEKAKTVSDGLEKISEKIIEQAIKKVQKIEHVIKVADLDPISTDAVLPPEFDKIVSLAANRVNIFLTGPSGCGKTHISAELAKVLGLPFHGQSCSAGMSESIFSGWLLPIGDSGKFEYVESPFVRAYENGGVFLFDEIDAADGNTMLFLNQALANNKFFLPQRFDNPVVEKHKDFIAIAAANTFGNGADSMYNSRNALDAASMDRFRMGVVELNYSDKVESALVDKAILALGQKIRKIISERRLRKIMSTRFMLDASKMKKAGWKMFDIFDSYSKDWSVEEKRLLSEVFNACRQYDLNDNETEKTIKDVSEIDDEVIEINKPVDVDNLWWKK